MKQNRLFGIIYLLLSKNTMTAKELSEYFEVSTRTIYRDIELLSELNIPIYMSKGKNGGIFLLENYKFDKSLLTNEEQNQILFSLQGMNKLQIDHNNIYEKLRNMFSKEDESWFEVDFSTWNKSDTHNQVFNLIKDAILNKNVVEFSYFNSYGKTAKRKVEPLKLYFRYNSWYLYGFDQEKKDYRFFKLMRIKNFKTLSQNFERVADIDFDRKDQLPKMVKLVMEIDKCLAYRIYDEFDESEITELGNIFLVKTKFPLNDWVYGYILSFGEHIKVLEPAFVKKEIIDKLNKSIDNYS